MAAMTSPSTARALSCKTVRPASAVTMVVWVNTVVIVQRSSDLQGRFLPQHRPEALTIMPCMAWLTNLDTVSFTYMRSAADCVLRAHPRHSESPGRRDEGDNYSTVYRTTHCFYCDCLLITTSCQLRGSFLPFRRQPQGFR